MLLSDMIVTQNLLFLMRGRGTLIQHPWHRSVLRQPCWDALTFWCSLELTMTDAVNCSKRSTKQKPLAAEPYTPSSKTLAGYFRVRVQREITTVQRH